MKLDPAASDPVGGGWTVSDNGGMQCSLDIPDILPHVFFVRACVVGSLASRCTNCIASTARIPVETRPTDAWDAAAVPDPAPCAFDAVAVVDDLPDASTSNVTFTL
jgi:hypothetical protein